MKDKIWIKELQVAPFDMLGNNYYKYNIYQDYNNPKRCPNILDWDKFYYVPKSWSLKKFWTICN